MAPRLLWADYLDRNTNVFQCSANWPLLPKMVSRSLQPGHPALAEAVSFVFNFSYGVNPDVFLSERLRPGIKESKNHALTDFYSRKVFEVLSPADAISFGERALVGNFLMGMRLFWHLIGRRMCLVNFHGGARSTFFLLVGGILGGQIWLFWMAMWSMGVFGIGRYRFRRFLIVGLSSLCNVTTLTIGRLCYGTDEEGVY